MAKYKAVMIRTVTYMEEVIVEAEDDYEARDIACEMALNDSNEFKESKYSDEWDFSWADEISD